MDSEGSLFFWTSFLTHLKKRAGYFKISSVTFFKKGKIPSGSPKKLIQFITVASAEMVQPRILPFPRGRILFL